MPDDADLLVWVVSENYTFRSSMADAKLLPLRYLAGTAHGGLLDKSCVSWLMQFVPVFMWVSMFMELNDMQLYTHTQSDCIYMYLYINMYNIYIYIIYIPECQLCNHNPPSQNP